MRHILLALLICFSTTVQAKITARSWAVADQNGIIIAEKNSNSTQPIASITKLMTAIVVLTARQDLNEQIVLNFKNTQLYHTKLPRTLKTLTRRELLQLAIVKSDNFAAYTLCDNYPGGVDRCVAEMNHQAVEFGMYSTRFADPTGLNEANISNASDLIKLVLTASRYSEITEASAKTKVSIKVKKRWWEFGNTNPLVRRSDNVIVSKTGYIHQSGGCVVMLLDTEYGQRIIALLGSKNTKTRIPEAEQIILTISSSGVNVE